MYVSLWDHNKDKSKGIDIYEFDETAGCIRFLKRVHEEAAFNMSKVIPQKQFMYILNETEHVPDVPYTSGRIYGFALDPETGDMTEKWHLPTGCPSPDYLDFSEDGKYMVISHHSCPEKITHFEKDASGHWVPRTICNDSCLQLYAMNEDGSIGELLDVKDHNPSVIEFDKGGHPRNNHPHSCLRAPLYHNLFCTPDKGDGYVYMYTIDEEKKELVQTDRVLSDIEGCKARYPQFHPTKPFLYVNHENAVGDQMHVSAFRYDAAGKLTRIGVFDGLEKPADTSQILSQQGFRISPDGRFLYSSCRNPNVVIVYAIDQETGELTLIQNWEDAGDYRRGLGITPDGRYLVNGCLEDGLLTVLSIGEDGRLTPTGSSGISKGASFISFFEA